MKFRAYSKDAKNMISWENLQSMKYLAMDREIAKQSILLPASENIVLMRCSNIKDMNGNEIYEGDIIERTIDGKRYKTEYKPCFIQDYHGNEFKFETFVVEDLFPLSMNDSDDMVIVGNIYEQE